MKRNETNRTSVLGTWEDQARADARWSVGTRIGIGAGMLVAAIAIGCMLSSCGNQQHGVASASSGMSFETDKRPDSPASTPVTTPAVSASLTPSVKPATTLVAPTAEDSVPPEIAGLVFDSSVTPGQVVAIEAEGSSDVTEVTMTDDLGRKQPMIYDEQSGLWRTYYRVPLRIKSDKIGLSLTAKNGSNRWHRVWIFLQVAEEDGCVIPSRTEATNG